MRHPKIGYVHQSLWPGILVYLIIVCPFLASAEQDDTQSEPQEISKVQNQNPPQLTRQDIHGIIAPLIETQESLKTRTTIYMVILGILLWAILLAFTWLFLRYRHLDSQLSDIRESIRMFSNVLRPDLLDISNRIQKLAKTSDLEKLATENQGNIQELLKRLKPTVDEAITEVSWPSQEKVDTSTNEVSVPAQEELESAEQTMEDTRDRKLSSSIADPCEHYNAGVQDDEVSVPSQEELESAEQIVEDTQKIEEDTSDLKLTQALANLCDSYNAGIQDKNKQNDFSQRYHNSYKIRVENATDRRVNQQVDPVFKTHHASGNFWGCYVEEGKLYAVVPVYQLRIVHAILHHGAFVDVFECHGVEFDDPDGCYEVVRIIEPAIFEPDDTKETWKFQPKGSKGILELKEV